MNTEPYTALRSAVIMATSRRGVLAGLCGWPLMGGTLAVGNHAVATGHARKRKHRRRKKHRRGGLAAATPSPVTRADVTCSGAASTFLFISGLDTGAGSRAAQTFTATASGQLVSASLLLDNQGAAIGELVLHLSSIDASGFPTSIVLAETAVVVATLPEGVSTVSFAFANPLAVMAGTTYALVLSLRGNTDIIGWAARSGNGCSGQPFTSATQTASFVAANPDRDLMFTTFVSA